MQRIKSKNSKRTLGYLAVLILVLFSLLPAVNIKHNGWPEDFRAETLTRLFSVDVLEGRINHFLFLMGVSGNYAYTIVGREGWLFLGDRYRRGLLKGRDLIPRSHLDLEGWIDSMAALRSWLDSEGIPLVFAIAPNKHSIYEEFLPEWAPLHHPNSTDRLISRAELRGFWIVDMRPELIRQKPEIDYLYRRTDTHWTQVGAYFGYRLVMQELSNALAGIDYLQWDQLEFELIGKKPGDLAIMLKMKTHLGKDYDAAYRVDFPGARDQICVVQRGESGTDLGECKSRQNSRVSVLKGMVTEVANERAKNDMAVLIVRDSFGNANGRLYNAAFTKAWHVYHGTLHSEEAFRQLVRTLQPEAVIYQIVERAVFDKPFYSFARK